MIITSKDNENVKHIKKLREKKFRDLYQEYVVEGIKLIEEAIKEQAKIKMIVICETCEKNESINSKLLYEIAKYNCIYVDEKIFNQITDVKSPQGILAVIEKNKIDDANINYNEELFVILDDVQDPGNIGTILRTVDSIGLTQIIISSKCGDVYNPKVIRSTMGAIFRVKVIQSQNLCETIKEMKKHKIKILATSLKAKKDIYDIDYKHTGILIGNEANGISKEVLEEANEHIKIPMLRKNRKSKRSSSNRNCTIRICKTKNYSIQMIWMLYNLLCIFI